MRERGGGSGVFFSSSTNSCFLQRIPGSAKRARHVGLDKNDLLMEVAFEDIAPKCQLPVPMTVFVADFEASRMPVSRGLSPIHLSSNKKYFVLQIASEDPKMQLNRDFARRLYEG